MPTIKIILNKVYSILWLKRSEIYIDTYHYYLSKMNENFPIKWLMSKTNIKKSKSCKILCFKQLLFSIDQNNQSYNRKTDNPNNNDRNAHIFSIYRMLIIPAFYIQVCNKISLTILENILAVINWKCDCRNARNSHKY